MVLNKEKKVKIGRRFFVLILFLLKSVFKCLVGILVDLCKNYFIYGCFIIFIYVIVRVA